MPYADRGSLSSVLNSIRARGEVEEMLARHLPEEDITNVAIQMGQAIREVHSRGVLHGDVKPENFLVFSNLQTSRSESDLPDSSPKL